MNERSNRKDKINREYLKREITKNQDLSIKFLVERFKVSCGTINSIRSELIKEGKIKNRGPRFKKGEK